MVDDRVNAALDLTVIWTSLTTSSLLGRRNVILQNGGNHGGWAAIDARKPDFAAYVEPQKKKADIVVQVQLPISSMTPLANPKGEAYPKEVDANQASLFLHEGSKIEWTPNADKLLRKPRVKIAPHDDWYGSLVQVIEWTVR